MYSAVYSSHIRRLNLTNHTRKWNHPVLLVATQRFRIGLFEQSKWVLPFTLFTVHEHLFIADSPLSSSEYLIYYKVGSFVLV